VLAWELFGNRAVRQGNWKLRWEIKPFGREEWELFDLSTDPGELKDLAVDHPDKVREMVALWDDYVRRDNVVLPNRSPFETLADQLPPRVPVQAGYPPLNLKRQYVPPPDMMADPKQ
jgi:arylsulfatase